MWKRIWKQIFTHCSSCLIILGSSCIDLTCRLTYLFNPTWVMQQTLGFPPASLASFSICCCSPSSSSSSSSKTREPCQAHWWFIYIRVPIFPSLLTALLCLSHCLTHTHTHFQSVSYRVCETLCDIDAKCGFLFILTWWDGICRLAGLTRAHTCTHTHAHACSLEHQTEMTAFFFGGITWFSVCVSSVTAGNIFIYGVNRCQYFSHFPLV